MATRGACVIAYFLRTSSWLAFVALAHQGSLAFGGLEVGVGARGSECVVGQAGGHEQEPCQEDGRECHGVNPQVTDARDDFAEWTCSCLADGHGVWLDRGMSLGDGLGGLKLRVRLLCTALPTHSGIGFNALPVRRHD